MYESRLCPFPLGKDMASKASLSGSKIDEANEDSFSCFVLFYVASVLMLYMCSLLIGWTTVS